MIVSTSVMNDVEEKEEKRNVKLESKMSIRKMKKIPSTTSGHENLGKYGAYAILNANKSNAANMLMSAKVTKRSMAMPRNFPIMYSERDIGFERTM